MHQKLTLAVVYIMSALILLIALLFALQQSSSIASAQFFLL
jgi:hypothetical protein